MQIFVVFFLAAFVGCYGDESGCLERSESCMSDFREDMQVSNSYRMCNEMIQTIGCLEEVAESCAGDENEDEMKLRIEHLKEEKNEVCSNRQRFSEDDEIQKCFEKNEYFFFQCISDSMDKVYDDLHGQSNVEVTEDRMTCGLYMRLGECFINRIGEKCGHEAVLEALRVISDVPDDVNEACLSIGIALSFGSLDEDKRKK